MFAVTPILPSQNAATIFGAATLFSSFHAASVSRHSLFRSRSLIAPAAFALS